MFGIVHCGTGLTLQTKSKMKIIVVFGVLFVVNGTVVLGAPVSVAHSENSARQIVFVPARFIYAAVPQAVHYPHQQIRGPFQFIGNWIDSSDWFPIEVNVPDMFSNIGSGVGSVAQTVGQFAQNMGAGIMTFTQNVGSGIQSFAQGIGQRVPFIAAIIRPTATVDQQPVPQRYMLVVPGQQYGDTTLTQMESDILETFPSNLYQFNYDDS